jgi:ferredoxin-NADP reductase
MSSTPSRPTTMSVTVKAQPGSVASRWMVDHLTPGMRIRAIGPAGIFALPGDLPVAGAKHLFISAGSGVTPMMSMLGWLYDGGEDPDACCIACARRPSELIFRRKLEHMATRAPGIKLHFVVAEEDPYEVWTGYRGRFNQLMLGLMAPDYLDREVWCCGPESFMQSVRETLVALGYDMARYHQESFHAPIETVADEPVHDDVVPQESEAAELVFTRSGVTAACRETDTVLGAAKAAGLSIPFGCTFGVCGACRIRKVSGEVHMVHSGGIDDEDIEDGYILACCSHPIGRVEVEV